MVSMLLVTLLTFWVWTLCAFSKLQFGVQVVALVSGSSDHPVSNQKTVNTGSGAKVHT